MSRQSVSSAATENEAEVLAAIQHHQAGRMGEAEAAYEKVLRAQPDHAPTLNMLGLLLAQTGRFDAGIEHLRHACQIAPTDAEYLANLAELLQMHGRGDQAIEALRKLLALKPHVATVHKKLAEALYQTGDVAQAEAEYRIAIALAADDAQAWNGLGNALSDRNELAEATAAYQRAIALSPRFAEAHNNLANALKRQGQLDAAIEVYHRSLRIRKDLPQVHNNLGTAYSAKRQLDKAVACYAQALRLKPDYPEAWTNLGSALRFQNQHAAAISAYERALALNPNLAEVHNNLSVLLRGIGLVDRAIAECQRALALKPDLPEAHNNLGFAYASSGRLDEARARFEQTMRLRPDDPAAHSNLVYLAQFDPRFDAAQILAETRRWNERHAAARRWTDISELSRIAERERTSTSSLRARASEPRAVESRRDQPPMPDRQRRLRIGYVSPDFRTHCQALFTLPLLSHHDHERFEIFCYSDVIQDDAMTDRLKPHADRWLDVSQMSHEQLAARVRADRIDVLIDLTMHMARNRLPMFAQKPAPVQANYLAYPGTTGVDAIDYRFSDPHLDPPPQGDDTTGNSTPAPDTLQAVADSRAACGLPSHSADIDSRKIAQAHQFYSEKTIRLPHTFWCYGPDSSVPVETELPLIRNGLITFGCLNNFWKVTRDVIRLWAGVMAAAPRSRLMLLAPQGSPRQRVIGWLAEKGLSPDRVDFVLPVPREEYLRRYHRIDLCLDTFPYNGHTTSLDALWMGVPVITLIGRTVVGRAGYSQLTNLGLSELAAQTPEEFIRIARKLATDPRRLQKLRMNLRPRMERSPLMDAAKFTADLEAAYLAMWHQWSND